MRGMAASATDNLIALIFIAFLYSVFHFHLARKFITNQLGIRMQDCDDSYAPYGDTIISTEHLKTKYKKVPKMAICYPS